MDPLVIPGISLAITLAGAGYAAWRAEKAEGRAERTDVRAAAQSSVDMLAQLNEALGRQVNDLQGRLERMEGNYDDCEKARDAALAEIVVLKARIAGL